MKNKQFYQSLSLLFAIVSIICFSIKMYILAAVLLGLFIRYHWYYDKNVNFKEVYQKLKNKKSLK